MVSKICDISRLHVAPHIKFYKLWYQARALLLPVPQAGKISASKLIHYFSSYPATFGSQASFPPDNITLNPSNSKIDQSLSDVETGIGESTNTTLKTEQLISCTRAAFLIHLPLYKVQIEEWLQLQKCWN